MVNSDAKLSKNIHKSLSWACRQDQKSELVIEAIQRDALTIYVTFKTENRSIKSNLTNYVLTKTVAEELNELYGSDLQDGHIGFGSTSQVSVQYSAGSTLGHLLD